MFWQSPFAPCRKAILRKSLENHYLAWNCLFLLVIAGEHYVLYMNVRQ